MAKRVPVRTTPPPVALDPETEIEAIESMLAECAEMRRSAETRVLEDELLDAWLEARRLGS